MRSHNLLFESIDQLDRALQAIDTEGTQSILVQIFSGLQDDDATLLRIMETVRAHFDKAVIIGASTAGEILEGTIYDQRAILSIDLFETVTLHSALVVSDDSYATGQRLAEKIYTEKTQAVLLFADGLHCNGEQILRGFAAISQNRCIVSGGMAGDGSRFQRAYVLYEGEIYERAAVAVALHGERLRAFNGYSLSWHPIGIPMTITRSEGNVVHEIDGKPVVEIYRDYFGDEVVENLPDSAIEFPLVFTKGGVSVARSIINVEGDKIIYAGEVPEGTQVRFGVASTRLFEKESDRLVAQSAESAPESIFVYSCIARKTFLGKELERELTPLAQIAPTSGFFTYGELYSGGENYEMLNITTTILALRERPPGRPRPSPKQKRLASLSTTALINLVEKSIDQLQQAVGEKEGTIALLNQYQNAIERSYIVSQTDLRGVITYVNDRFCEISGYRRDELIGKPHSIVRHPDTPKAVFKEMWATIQSGRIWRGEIENRHKSGRSYYVNATIFPILNHRGEITGYMGVRNDVTGIVMQKKRSEAILNSQESIVILTTLDEKEARLQYLNRKFFELFDYESTEAFLQQHRCISELFLPQEGYLAPVVENLSWMAYLLRHPHEPKLTLMHDRHGRERVFSVTARAVETEFDTQRLAIATFTDVTELEEARRKALAAEKAKSAFLATMSHELRTPLNAVIGFSQILMMKRDMPFETMKSYLEKIHLSGKHLLELVNDILDFTKIESGEMRLTRQPISPDRFLHELHDLVESLCQEKSIQLTIDCQCDHPIKADEKLLRQALLNLLSNAIKFSPEGGTVQLTCQREKGETILSVGDEGPGLAPEEIDAIFQPFRQVERHQTGAIKGTGLGLAIVRKIMQLHGGDVEVQSQPGKGARFLLHLPDQNEG